VYVQIRGKIAATAKIKHAESCSPHTMSLTRRARQFCKRLHRGSDFREAPKVHLDGNAVAKLMATYRAIERGSWKTKAKGKHGGALGRPALRLLETFLLAQ
jgi:hypothetical protein